jgi:hypothetical protein
LKTTINLTNVGIGQKDWRAYTELLNKNFSNFDILIKNKSIKSGWFNKIEDIQSDLIKSDPDIVFISEKILLASLQDKIDFSQLMTILKKKIKFIVVSHDLQPLCLTLINAKALFYFKNIQEGLKLEAGNLWYTGLIDNSKFELESIPDFTFNQKEYLPKTSSCFIPNEKIKLVIWKGKTYPLIQFYAFFKEYIFNNDHAQKPIGFIFYQEKCYICLGFLQSEIVKIDYQGLIIDHIIQDGFCNDIDASAQTKQLIGIVRFVINWKLIEEIQNSEQTIKQNTPVHVAVDNVAISKTFSEVLKDDGYFKTRVFGKAAMEQDCFTIHLNDKQDMIAKKGQINLDISNVIVNKINNGDFESFFHSYNILPDLIIRKIKDIETERVYVRKKIKGLKENKQVLRSTRVLNHQEQYQNFITQRKLDILISLMESALIWDEKQHKTLELSDENALVFYDDHIQGSIINKQLKGIRKNKLFVNIAEKLNSLEKIAAVDTDYIEQFLHSGVVVCCKSSQIILERNFRIFKHKLMQEYGNSSSNQSRKIQEKIDECLFRLNELTLYELFQQLYSIYEVNRDAILQGCQKIYGENLNNKFKKNKFNRISIVSHQKNNGYLIKTVLEEIFRIDDASNHKFHIPWSELELISALSGKEADKLLLAYPDKEERELVKQQDIANLNAVEVANYFNRLLYQIKVFDPDIIILDHDAELLHVLIKMLRNEYEVLGLKPIIAIVTGEFIPADINDLLQQNVNIIASELHDIGDVYCLRDALQKLFLS